jgi:hypothetical protein
MMTCEVIDATHVGWSTEAMTADPATDTTRRFDRTVRTVMWLDAFLSVAIVVASIVAVPAVAILGVPDAITEAVAAVSLVSAVLLAAFGAITAVLLMLRMRAGQYFLPAQLRLPLPPPLRPPL